MLFANQVRKPRTGLTTNENIREKSGENKSMYYNGLLNIRMVIPSLWSQVCTPQRSASDTNGFDQIKGSRLENNREIFKIAINSVFQMYGYKYHHIYVQS